jgi:uncharacterized protein
MNDFPIIFLSGFSIGILGSFHCIGMCGPLALALPVDQLNTANKTASILLYNIGRAISYAAMGVLFGIVGQSFELFFLQQWLSVLSGVLILSVLLFTKFGHPQGNIMVKFSQTIKHRLSTYLRSDKKLLSYLSIGMVNGFLPCGLVYIAIAASIAAGSIFKSSLLMFAFGIGTLPIMALTMAFGKFISFSLRKKLNKISPYLIMGVALLLILRGLNLGIPYISPQHDKGHVNCCGHKE